MSNALPTLCFVVPALDGPISGGTSYNRELCRALAEYPCRVLVCSLEDAQLESFVAAARHTFVDTLYLDAFPELARRVRDAGGSAALLTHYLPALVTAGRAVDESELGASESRALAAADALLVTSDFMCRAMTRLTSSRIFVIEPGSRAQLAAFSASSTHLRAIAIANLVPGKGIAPLLRGFAAALHDDDPLELSIVGRLDAEPAYAAHCRRLIDASSVLAHRVTLRGPMSPEQTQLALADAELFVSASSMESYGMALAEARITGVPIIACSGGHSAAHVEVEAGGQLVASPRELADACVALARNAADRAERRARARRHAPLARSWARAATELLDQLARHEK